MVKETRMLFCLVPCKAENRYSTKHFYQEHGSIACYQRMLRAWQEWNSLVSLLQQGRQGSMPVRVKLLCCGTINWNAKAAAPHLKPVGGRIQAPQPFPRRSSSVIRKKHLISPLCRSQETWGGSCLQGSAKSHRHLGERGSLAGWVQDPL